MTAIAVGNTPQDTTFTLDGSKAYVCNNGDSTVSIIDVATQLVLSTLAVDAFPTAMATDPVSGMIYCLAGAALDYIDPSTDMVVNSVSGFVAAYNFAVDPTGTTIYVTDYFTGQVVDIATAAITGTYGSWTGGSPFWEATLISPSGGTLYLLDNGGNVDVYDTGTLLLTSTNPVGAHTATGAMALTPDGSTLWITDGSDATVTMMDTTTFACTDFALGSNPNRIAIDPAGTSAFVGDYTGGSQVFTVDVATQATTNTQAVATSVDGVRCTPDGSQVWVVSQGAAVVYVLSGLAPTLLTGVTATVVIDAPDAPLSTGSIAALVGVTATVEVDAPPAPLSFPLIADKEVRCLVLAGDPLARGLGVMLTPTPPSPVPGPFGNHSYEVVVCDKYGIAQGVIGNAVPTQVDYELDGIGQCLIDFPLLDQKAATLLPMSDIPGVREIQLWRDQALIWWGWPTGVTWDSVQVHLTCSGLLWPLSTRELGPPAIHLMANPQFEQGLEGWSAVDCFAAATTTNVALGKQAAALLQLAAGSDSFLRTTVVVDLTASPAGFAFNLAAWFYIDTSYTYSGPALDNRGLFWEDDLGNFGFAQIDASGPFDIWTRIEVTSDGGGPAFIAQPGRVTTYDFRLYCPGGSIVWDDVQLAVIENVSSPPPSPPATEWDVTDICLALVASAQSAVWSKSDLAFQFYGAPTGVLLNRVYLIDTNQVLLDCLNEFPSIGACDFEMVWDDTGHFRGFQVFGPAKGSIKWNAVLDISVNETTEGAGAVDGTQVGTTQRVLGQGSSGAAQDTGYAQFASYLGGRTFEGGITVIGVSSVSSFTANFTTDDIGENVYSLEGALSPGTFITGIVSATEALINNPALLSLNGQTIGVGGITIDRSTSALPDQPISTLQGTAQGLLIQQMLAQALPAPKIRADGPNGLFGLVTVGDVILLSGSYGWLQIEPQLMRIAKLTLYPPTEELTPVLMPVNALPSGS